MGDKKDMREILFSLDYLAEEARRMGYRPINRMIKVCMIDITVWMQSANNAPQASGNYAKASALDIFDFACEQFLHYRITHTGRNLRKKTTHSLTQNAGKTGKRASVH